MEKMVIFGSFIILVIILITPSIPAVQNQVIINSIHKKIIEYIENENYKELKSLLVQFIDDTEEPSDRVLHLRGLLDEIDKYSENNRESKIINSILHLLFSVIGVVLIVYGGSLYIRVEQGSYKIVGLIAFLIDIIFVLLVT